MTVRDALRDSGLDPADAQILLAAALGRDRSWILAHEGDDIDADAAARFAAFAERRRTGEPVAYILGEKEFYGRMFRVTRSTLIPRPATELLCEQVLRSLNGETIERIREIDTDIVAWSEQKNMPDVRTAIDVGTGSGCIAITLACERPDLRIIATDISEEALAVARENAVRHGVADRIAFRQGSGLDPLADLTEPFLLVSNPPYIPAGTPLERDVEAFEPASALFAGGRGTDVLCPLVDAARSHPFCRGFIVECRVEQTDLESNRRRQ